MNRLVLIRTELVVDQVFLEIRAILCYLKQMLDDGNSFLVYCEVKYVHHSIKCQVYDLFNRQTKLFECWHVIVSDCKYQPFRWGKIACCYVLIRELVT